MSSAEVAYLFRRALGFVVRNNMLPLANASRLSDVMQQVGTNCIFVLCQFCAVLILCLTSAALPQLDPQWASQRQFYRPFSRLFEMCAVDLQVGESFGLAVAILCASDAPASQEANMVVVDEGFGDGFYLAWADAPRAGRVVVSDFSRPVRIFLCRSRSGVPSPRAPRTQAKPGCFYARGVSGSVAYEETLLKEIEAGDTHCSPRWTPLSSLASPERDPAWLMSFIQDRPHLFEMRWDSGSRSLLVRSALPPPPPLPAGPPPPWPVDEYGLPEHLYDFDA